MVEGNSMTWSNFIKHLLYNAYREVLLTPQIIIRKPHEKDGSVMITQLIGGLAQEVFHKTHPQLQVPTSVN